MSEWIGAIAGIVAVAGVVLNNRMNRWCFVLWMASNAISAGLHAAAGMWSLAGRDIVFLLLAVEGWIRWGGRRREIYGDEEPPAKCSQSGCKWFKTARELASQMRSAYKGNAN